MWLALPPCCLRAQVTFLVAGAPGRRARTCAPLSALFCLFGWVLAVEQAGCGPVLLFTEGGTEAFPEPYSYV